MGIDPAAHVRDSEIGDGTDIWQFASVIRGASIGKGCTIGAYALVDGARIGDDCRIQSGAQIHPGVWIGDRVFIGPSAVLCNDRWPCVDKEGFDAKQFKDGLVTIFVHEGSSIGANAVILPGMTIGKKVVVAAGAVVNRSVPDEHLFTREGKIVPIKPEWRRRRMWAA